MKFSAIILSFLMITSAHSSSWAQEPSASVLELQESLKKVNESISVTKEKIGEVKDAKFLPDLYFALAELYVNKSRFEFTLAREKNPKAPLAEIDFSESTKAKRFAIEAYQKYIDNFPQGENVDRALFFIAHEYREMGQDEAMIATYQKLIKEFPKSRFWAETQLILGDHYFDKVKDMKSAQGFYEKVLSRSPNPFVPFARYKLGWCFINQNSFEKALEAFETVVVSDAKISMDQLPEIYKKTDVVRDSLLAMVWPYSEQKKLTGDRVQALNYFEKLSPNRPALAKVLGRLVKRLMLKEKVDQALPVYFRLLEMTHELETRLDLANSFYEAFKKSKKQWPVQALMSPYAEILNQVRFSPSLKKTDKFKTERNFEIYLRDFATQLQVRAKKTKKDSDFLNALSAYNVYLEVYPRTKYSKALLLNAAESAYSLKKYPRAGYLYEQLVRQGANDRSVLDSAIQSYANALKEEDKISRLEQLESREGLRALGAMFIKKYPQDKAIPGIYLSVGRTYYDERDFDRAISVLSTFVTKFPKHKEAPAAARLVLDSYNQKDDLAGLAKKGKELLKTVANAKFQKDVAEMIKQAEFKKVRDQSGDSAKNLLSFAAKNKGTALGDQALYEAFISLKGQKDPEAYEPGEQLLEFHADSKYAKDVVSQMGQMALNSADYRRAAKYFEIFARKFPKDPLSRNLLKTSADLRKLLGDEREAADDLLSLGQPEAAAEVYLDHHEWSKAFSILSSRGSATFEKNYGLGLASLKMGDGKKAQSYLRAAVSAMAGVSQKDKIAHAHYLLALANIKEFEGIEAGGNNETAKLKDKSARLEKIETDLAKTISFKSGVWTIASLYQSAKANQGFADFVAKTSVPSGLNASQENQYRQLIEQQVQQFRNKSAQAYKACAENAEKYEVFTAMAKACQLRSTVDEEEVHNLRAEEGSPTEASDLRRALLDKPRDLALLMKLAQVYLANQDYAFANLIYNRILEIQANSAVARAGSGLCLMFMSDYEAAAEQFKLALKSKSEPLAQLGLAALYKEFSFNKRFQQVYPQVKGRAKPAGVLHPWMEAL